MFFSYHDLTHFAVETTLAFKHGFYGLIASGWDIIDTEGKGPRGKPPAESILVEHVVGLLDRERVGGAQPLTAAEFNEQLRHMAATNDILVGTEFTELELMTTRKPIRDLQHRWASVSTATALELAFNQ